MVAALKQEGVCRLPASSAACVRLVQASSSNVTAFPEGMAALREVHVTSCKSLARDWLPASSAAAVRAVIAPTSNMQRLPDMPCLEDVNVQRCDVLMVDWLPAGSTARYAAVSAPALRVAFSTIHARFTIRPVQPSLPTDLTCHKHCHGRGWALDPLCTCTAVQAVLCSVQGICKQP